MSTTSFIPLEIHTHGCNLSSEGRNIFEGGDGRLLRQLTHSGALRSYGNEARIPCAERELSQIDRE